MQNRLKQDGDITAGNIVLWYLIILIGAGLLYVFTCAPAILWQDSGLFVYRIWQNDLEGNLGLALAHPLYIIIGIAIKLIPFGDLAYKINLVSSFFGALTVANVFLLCRLLLKRIFPAVIGSITIAVCWNFWQQAVIAEVYTLFTAQMTFELIFLLLYLKTGKIKLLYLLAFFNGLAIANHLWGIFGLLCYVVLVFILLSKKQIKIKQLMILALLWIAGAAPYEYLIIKDIFSSGDVQGVLTSALFGNTWNRSVLNTAISKKIFLENIIFISLNFPTPNVILFFAGLSYIKKTKINKSLIYIIFAMLVLHFVFAFRYTVPDRFVFFLPSYCLAAIFISIGADAFTRRYGHKVVACLILIFSLLPTAIYCVTPEIARKVYKPLAERRQRPYRDEYNYFLQPWKRGYRGAEKFAFEALDTVEEGAIVYAYTTDVHSLLYVQEVKGYRRDVKIVSDYDSSENSPAFTEDTIDNLLEKSAIYVASPFKKYCPDFLFDNYNFIKVGILWRVTERKEDVQE